MVFWLMFLTRNLCKDKKNFHSCTIKLILYNSAVFRCCGASGFSHPVRKRLIKTASSME